MNRAKRSAEAVGCKNESVGERSALEERTRASSGGRSGSENVSLSNANVKEVGDLMTGEPATEASVNGGRNYNGPKASQKVTEACKGFLGPDGDWPSSTKAEGSLTARPTRRAGTKVGLSDPTVWHLDVGSSPLGAVVCSKGWAVRPLKRYVSWVQNVVRQFGPYPVWALEH
ncbi:hypothetical protein AHAS_Ahas16G0164300 [Arachis hypogaea]